MTPTAGSGTAEKRHPVARASSPARMPHPRGIPASPRPNGPRPALLHPRASRRRLGLLRSPGIVAVVLILGSLLAVGAAQAYLVSGQVRLARLDQILSQDQRQHRDLELKVAELESPARIVHLALHDGLVEPPSITDLPQVPLGNPVTRHADTSALPASATAGKSSAPGAHGAPAALKQAGPGAPKKPEG